MLSSTSSTLFRYTTLFRSLLLALVTLGGCATSPLPEMDPNMAWVDFATPMPGGKLLMAESLDGQRLRDGRFFQDRKSTRLNSSHLVISYAVFCLKKKKRRK